MVDSLYPAFFKASMSNVQTVCMSILKHPLNNDASRIKYYAEKSFIIVEISGNTVELRYSFFFGIVAIILNSA